MAKFKNNKNTISKTNHTPKLLARDGLPIKIGDTFKCLVSCTYGGMGCFSGITYKVIRTSRKNSIIYIDDGTPDDPMDYDLNTFNKEWIRV
jgi:hypothetical protein